MAADVSRNTASFLERGGYAMTRNALNHQQQVAGIENRLGWRLAEWVAMTGTSRPTIWRQIKRGDLKIVRVGGIPLVPRTEAVRLGLIVSPANT
jgi:hypothetical protein